MTKLDRAVYGHLNRSVHYAKWDLDQERKSIAPYDIEYAPSVHTLKRMIEDALDG